MLRGARPVSASESCVCHRRACDGLKPACCVALTPPGTCLVQVWDNGFSWLQSKTIIRTVEVESSPGPCFLPSALIREWGAFVANPLWRMISTPHFTRPPSKYSHSAAGVYSARRYCLLWGSLPPLVIPYLCVFFTSCMLGVWSCLPWMPDVRSRLVFA